MIGDIAYRHTLKVSYGVAFVDICRRCVVYFHLRRILCNVSNSAPCVILLLLGGDALRISSAPTFVNRHTFREKLYKVIKFFLGNTAALPFVVDHHQQ